MKIEIISKHEKGDEVFVEAFGINTYRRVQIVEVAATRDNKSFIYRILSHNSYTGYNWIPEKNVYNSLFHLQEKWRTDLLTPKEY